MAAPPYANLRDACPSRDMADPMTTTPNNAASLGIFFVLIGMFCISINDLLIKQLSGDYPLHELVFVRSGIGILIGLLIVQY